MADRPGIAGVTMMIAAAVVLAAAAVVLTSARRQEGPGASPVRLEPPMMVVAAPDERAPGPADRRPDPLRHGPRSRRGLSPELIEQCLAVARDVDPTLADRLEGIRREKSAEDFARALQEARSLRHLVALKEEDPQLYDVKVKELRLDAQADRLLEQLAEARRTPGADVTDLEAQLHGVVQQQVAVSLVARGMYLRRLNEHVKALREQLEHDLGDFQQAVDRRMKSLLDEVEKGAGPAAP